MEKRTFRLPGFLMLLVLLAVAAVPIWYGARLGEQAGDDGLFILIVVAAVLVDVLILSGFIVLNPNEAGVIQFFGRYIGSVRKAGFHWVAPLTSKRKVTLRVRNFETTRLKVSDADGNPVEIAAVVVFRVVDSAKAVFAVDDHTQYVAVQAEAAVRHLATSYPYESHDGTRASLRDSSVVSPALTTELRERVELAGVEVLESRVTHLAYAPEIAQAMLVRQQANAVVAARAKIVEGAVGMVRGALDQLAELNVVTLDEERKAQMVANLLVVLCADRATQPVINTGTLYG
ncbi:MAG: SPFH domain-containing protein [Micromonosporaceae bacterium]|nr:SPFH domain-containing protein [Micromonosporaceae bacterium]